MRICRYTFALIALVLMAISAQAQQPAQQPQSQADTAKAENPKIVRLKEKIVLCQAKVAAAEARMRSADSLIAAGRSMQDSVTFEVKEIEKERKIIERDQPDLDAVFDKGKTLREAIIAPTRLYVKPILAALKEFDIKGMAHITGGGITENVPRVLPENCVAQIDANAWQLPKLFQWLQQAGNVETQEMYRTFNCGIGMVVIVDANIAEQISAFLGEQGETVYRLGVICERKGDEHQTQVV